MPLHISADMLESLAHSDGADKLEKKSECMILIIIVFSGHAFLVQYLDNIRKESYRLAVSQLETKANTYGGKTFGL